VVRHAQGEAEQADDGADQALGLAVGEAEHGAQGERRQDGERQIPELSARGRARLCRPPLDRLGAEPHRQATAPAKSRVIGRPVRDLVCLSRDVVAAVLIQLEGQGGHPRSGQGQPPTPGRGFERHRAGPCTICGRLPLGKGNFRVVVTRSRMLPSVRPRIRQRTAADLHGSSRTGSRSRWRTLRYGGAHWLSRSRLADRCAMSSFRSPYASVATAGLRRHGRSPVRAALDQQRPDDAGRLVGQGGGDQHARLAREHPRQP
jgi:hypothetical protein